MLSRCVFAVIGFVLLTFYFLLGLSSAQHTAYCFYIKKMGHTCLISQRNSQQPWGTKECGFQIRLERCGQVPGFSGSAALAHNVILCLLGCVLNDSGFRSPSSVACVCAQPQSIPGGELTTNLSGLALWSLVLLFAMASVWA